MKKKRVVLSLTMLKLILYNFAGEVELAPAARLLLEERRVCVCV